MKRKLTALFGAVVLAAVFAGCGAKDQTQSSSEAQAISGATKSGEMSNSMEKASDDAAWPVTISHAYGDTVIEKQPERVVTLSYGNQDVVLALGVVPVGFSATNYGVQDESGLLPWTREKLESLGETKPNVFQDTDGFDYEAIADSKPDIILAPYSGMTREEYDMLSKIAPVVAYPKTAWTISSEDWIRITAKALGLTEKGEDLIAHMESVIDTKKKEHPEFAGKEFVWITFDEKDLSSLHAYSPEDTRVKFLSEFGFSYPKSVDQYMEEGKFALNISTENADLLYDADFIIGYSTDSAYEAAAKDPVLGKIPALKNKAVVAIGDGTPLSAALSITPLSFDYAIDEYVDKLAEAVKNIQ